MKAIFFLLFTSLLILGYSCGLVDTQKTTVQTAANEPTIKRGETLSYSKSTKPKLFDFICFLGEVPSLPDKYIMQYRLCGMPGDKVQIKDGDFYLNDKVVDNFFSLKHNYSLTKTEFEKIKSLITIDDNYNTDLNADTVVIPIDDQFVEKNKIVAKRQILPISLKDSIVASRFSQPWNRDNFGPINVPPNSYFVLGDNRHNAWDSRYRGFINKEVLLGTVILNK